MNLPPENFKQDLGYNPFDLDRTISDGDHSLGLVEPKHDDDSLYLMDQNKHIKPGYGGRRMIDPDDSLNDSGRYKIATQTHKLLNVNDKKPTEKVGE